MHIISQKALKVFARRHPNSQAALDAWYQLVNANDFESLVALRKLFPHADKVGVLSYLT